MQIRRYEFIPEELSYVSQGHLHALGGVTFSLLTRLGMPERCELAGDMGEVAGRLGVQNMGLLAAEDLPAFSGSVSERGLAVGARLAGGDRKGNVSLVGAFYFVHMSPFALPSPTERLFPDTSVSAMRATYWTIKEDNSARQTIANSSVNLLRRLLERLMDDGLPEGAQWSTID